MKPFSPIFNPVPKYEIKKEFQDGQVGFSVKFNVSALNYDYETHAEKFSHGEVNNVNFDILNDRQILLSVKHNQQFSSDADHEFRTAIGVISRHNIQSTEAEDILKNYNQFLKEKDMMPSRQYQFTS